MAKEAAHSFPVGVDLHTPEALHHSIGGSPCDYDADESFAGASTKDDGMSSNTASQDAGMHSGSNLHHTAGMSSSTAPKDQD